MLYAVQHTDQIFVKGYGFYLLLKTISKNIGQNISKA